MHWQHVEPRSSRVEMGDVSQPDGCATAQMTAETAQTNFPVPAVSIMDFAQIYVNPTIPQSNDFAAYFTSSVKNV